MPRVYDLRVWKQVRIAQLVREPMCRHCALRGIHRPATDVDHIVRIADGGDWFDPENLQSLCHECHAMKTAREEGKTVRMGCDVNGRPLDPLSHWNR